jgi:hypothetical protein
MKEKKVPEVSWINIHDDALMVKLGIYKPQAEPRDPQIWTKTKQEKKLLKSLRSKGKMHFGTIYSKPIPVQDKLIIQLKKNKKFPYTTYSMTCSMNQIGDILRFFCDKTGNLVSKYYFNGKTYKPSERPFWGVL